MDLLNKVFFSLKKLFSFGRANSELDDEIQFHIEMSIKQKIANGMSRENAEREAKREFGNDLSIRESCRMSWGARFVDEWIQDLKLAFRRLAKNKIFCIPVMVVLAICMAFCLLFYSIVDQKIINRFPYPNHKEIIQIGQSHPSPKHKDSTTPLNGLICAEIKKHKELFESYGFQTSKGSFIKIGDSTSFKWISYETPAMWNVYRLVPFKGRFFTSEDLKQGNQNVAVVSHHFASKHFTNAENALLKWITVDDQRFQIIGVLRRNQYTLNSNDIVIPLSSSLKRAEGERLHRWSFVMYARLNKNVTQNELNALLPTLRDNATAQNKNLKSYFDSYKIRLKQTPATQLRFYGKFDTKTLLILLLTLGTILYILTTINWLSVFHTNLTKGHREVGILNSLGARRHRIIRILLIENTLIYLLASAISIIILVQFRQLAENTLLFERDTLELKVNALFLLIVMVGVGVFVSLPSIMLKTSKKALEGAFRNRQNSTSIRSKGLVVSNAVQVTLTIILVMFSILFSLNMNRILTTDYGFDYKDRVVAFVQFPNWKFSDSYHKRINTLEQICSDLEQRFRTFGICSSLPQGTLSFYISTTGINASEFPIQPEGTDSINIHSFKFRFCGPQTLNALNFKLLKGRWLQEADAKTEEIEIVIQQNMVDDLFGEVDPIGKAIFDKDEPSAIFKIVGVIQNVDHDGKQGEMRYKTYDFYLSGFEQNYEYLKFWNGGYHIVVLSPQNKTQNLLRLKEIIHSVDPDLCVTLADYEDQFYKRYGNQILVRDVSTLLSILTVLVAAFGLFSFLYFKTNVQKKELAIRLSLGAKLPKLIPIYIFKNAIPVIAGSFVGICTVFILFKKFEERFTEVSSNDPLPYILITAVMLCIVCLASVLPIHQIRKISLRETLSGE